MIGKTFASSLALAALFATAVPAWAQEKSTTLDRPGVGVHEIKEGDKVPDEFKRKELALTDWKQRKLSAPGEDEQWVEINDKYVLVSIPNGTVSKMQAK